MLQNLALIAVLAAPQASSVVAQVELAGVTRATGEEEARISGRVELSAPAADQAALEKLGDECRWQLERRAEELLELRRPFWLPEALGRRALDRWLGRVDPLDVVEIVDRSRTERDHGDYVSYQTALVVRTDPQRAERAVARYSRELDRTANRFGAVVGGRQDKSGGVDYP